MNFNRFTDQVAIVPGGADGLGKAMADRLVREGATVCIFDSNDSTREATVAEFAERGCSVGGTAVDVGDEASVRHAIAGVVDAHGRLDVMINCAGIVGQTNVKAVEYDVDVFDKVINVNREHNEAVVEGQAEEAALLAAVREEGYEAELAG